LKKTYQTHILADSKSLLEFVKLQMEKKDVGISILKMVEGEENNFTYQQCDDLAINIDEHIVVAEKVVQFNFFLSMAEMR
jgi:hypothetical protein